MLVALLLVSVPAWFCWLLADGVQRRVIRLPAVIVSGANALYVTFIAAPLGFVVLFALLVVRARMLQGDWPRPSHVDPHRMFEQVWTPHPMHMPIHVWSVFVLFCLALAAIVGVPALWPLLRVERGETLRKIVRVFLPGMTILWALCLLDPGQIVSWFFEWARD
jgi:hypothetical protein